MRITRLNPETMHKSPAFTQVAVVDASAKLVFVGGQNGVDASGKVVGTDVGSQSAQAYKNVITALEAAGAGLNDVIKLNVYLVQGQSLLDAFNATQQGQQAAPPTVTVIEVAGLANPDFLIEIDAIAAVSGG